MFVSGSWWGVKLQGLTWGSMLLDPGCQMLPRVLWNRSKVGMLGPAVPRSGLVGPAAPSRPSPVPGALQMEPVGVQVLGSVLTVFSGVSHRAFDA